MRDPVVEKLDEVIHEIDKATERYCYHSVLAVWLQHHLETMDSEYSKEIELAIRDTNRTFEKLKANG